MNIKTPSLIEPGVKFFLKKTLKQCNTNKNIQFYYWWNMCLFLLFLFILGSLLIWKKKTRLTKEEITNNHTKQKNYIIEKINSIRESKKREREKENHHIITTLPKFESDYERMHKNFYKT